MDILAKESEALGRSDTQVENLIRMGEKALEDLYEQGSILKVYI